jgi:hypothetical protein
MGQPITAVTTSSSRPGTVRFEINRSLTGMGHERYRADQPVEDDRPPDRLARALFEHGGVESVHVYANVITLELAEGADLDGLREIVEQLYIYYRPGVEVVVPGADAAEG